MNEVAGPERAEARRGLLKFLALPWLVILGVCLLWGPIQSWLGVEPAQVGQAAPDFTLPIVAGEGAAEGDRLRLTDLRGRVVVLDFWATWCPPCRRSMPLLSRVQDRHRAAGVQVVGVNLDMGLGAGQIAEAARAFGGTFRSLHDADGSVQRAYQVSNLPTTVVVDTGGVVRHVHVGVPDEEELDAQIRSLLR